MSASLRTVTLGCKVNQYETEFVREGLLGIGYHDAAEGELADLCVVNTCTVTNEGDSKSRHTIRKLARDNPGTRIVVMGCYATRAPDEVTALPNVTEVITDKRELPDFLGRFGVLDVPTGISEFSNRHRAYVKVQDGCMLRCSYCIIPYVRPELTSRPIEHITAEVTRLVANGYRELILTGIHLGHYGIEWNWRKPKAEWTRLSDLVRQICELPGDFRIRLSSIEATEVTRELLAVMADFPERICPHLHICLQSGSDAILRKMRRRWSAKMFVDRCELARTVLDNPAFTTDIIVGFPGETENDFEATCRVARDVGFSKIHIFPFSARKGTPAATMTDHVDVRIKVDRVSRLEAIATELRHKYLQGLIGSSVKVLVESEADDPNFVAAASTSNASFEMSGTSCRYAPVAFHDSQRRAGELVNVRVTSLSTAGLQGVIAS